MVSSLLKMDTLSIARELNAIAQTGLHFTADEKNSTFGGTGADLQIENPARDEMENAQRTPENHP
jgi:hypothetical protein